jgi:regulator of sigma D
MKMRRIKDVKQIDTKFETLIEKIQAHRALIKLKYNDCFKMEEQRINQELENFEKHMSLINFNKETVFKIVEELESGQSNKISGGSEVANKIENFKKIQDELEEQTQRLQEVQISYPQVQVSMDGFEIIDKEVEQLVSIFHNKYLMSDKRIAFFGDTNKVMYLDLKKGEWTIKTINNNSNSQRGIGSNSGNS